MSFGNTRLGRWLGVALAGAVAFGSVGCGSDMDSSAGMGATPGGAQDNALANTKIEAGGVPKPEDITVEGALAAHDLPLEGVTCERELCVNAAFAVAPMPDATRSGVFVQLGFASNVDPATFERAPLNLAVVVDRSGSMAGDKIVAARLAVERLIDQLDERDRLAVVLFDDEIDVIHESAPVTDRAALHALVGKIQARGATNLADGLREGFAQVEAHLDEAGKSERVLLLTDAVVNTGDTDTTTFVELAGAAAAKDIGLSLFGIGTDLNQDLVVEISKLAGGNYVFLPDGERVAEVFGEEFDYLVSPLAYDLHFTLTPASSFRLATVYGYPAWHEGLTSVTFDVKTVFLSRNRGAIVARLDPIEGWPTGRAPLADLTLSYRPANAAEPHSEELTSVYEGDVPLDDRTSYWSERGVRRTVAYVHSALAQRTACGLYYDGAREDAIALLATAESLVRSEGAALGDAELGGEADLLRRLATNMGNGDTSGTSYHDEYGEDDQACYYAACAASALGRRPDTLWLTAAAFALMALGRRLTGRSRRA